MSEGRVWEWRSGRMLLRADFECLTCGGPASILTDPRDNATFVYCRKCETQHEVIQESGTFSVPTSGLTVEEVMAAMRADGDKILVARVPAPTAPTPPAASPSDDPPT